MAVVDARKNRIRECPLHLSAAARACTRCRCATSLPAGLLTVEALNASLGTPSVSPMRPAPLFLE